MKKVATVIMLLAFALAQTMGCAWKKTDLSRVPETKDRRELSEELLSLMNVQDNIEEAFEAVKQMQMSQLKSMGLSGEAADRAQSMQEKVMDVIAEEMSWDKLKEDYIDIYAETFTEDELSGLIEFYKSPVGQKFIDKNPELMKKTMEVTQKQLALIMPKIQQITMETMREEGKAPAGASGGAPAAAPQAE